MIWKEVLASFRVIKKGLLWKIGNGEQLPIGVDRWVSCGKSYLLPTNMVMFLKKIET